MIKFTNPEQALLFKQYDLGSSFKQKIAVKIFNPYGGQTWYIMNQDPENQDYLWGVVVLFADVGPEMGSISLSELTELKVPPFGMGLEKDKYFDQITVDELYEKLNNGVHV